MNYSVKNDNRAFGANEMPMNNGFYEGDRRSAPVIRNREALPQPYNQQSAGDYPIAFGSAGASAPSGFILMKTSNGGQTSEGYASALQKPVDAPAPEPMFTETPSVKSERSFEENIRENWKKYIPAAGAAGGALLGLSYMQSGLKALSEAGKVNAAIPRNTPDALIKALSVPLLLGIATIGAVCYVNRESEDITRLKIEKGYF